MSGYFKTTPYIDLQRNRQDSRGYVPQMRFAFRGEGDAQEGGDEADAAAVVVRHVGPGSVVLMEPDEGGDPHIFAITKIMRIPKHQRDGDDDPCVRMRGRWLYRLKDLSDALPAKQRARAASERLEEPLRERELLYSNHEQDDMDPRAILHPCQVLFQSPGDAVPTIGTGRAKRALPGFLVRRFFDFYKKTTCALNSDALPAALAEEVRFLMRRTKMYVRRITELYCPPPTPHPPAPQPTGTCKRHREPPAPAGGNAVPSLATAHGAKRAKLEAAKKQRHDAPVDLSAAAGRQAVTASGDASGGSGRRGGSGAAAERGTTVLGAKRRALPERAAAALAALCGLCSAEGSCEAARQAEAVQLLQVLLSSCQGLADVVAPDPGASGAMGQPAAADAPDLKQAPRPTPGAVVELCGLLQHAPAPLLGALTANGLLRLLGTWLVALQDCLVGEEAQMKLLDTMRLMPLHPDDQTWMRRTRFNKYLVKLAKGQEGAGAQLSKAAAATKVALQSAWEAARSVAGASAALPRLPSDNSTTTTDAGGSAATMLRQESDARATMVLQESDARAATAHRADGAAPGSPKRPRKQQQLSKGGGTSADAVAGAGRGGKAPPTTVAGKAPPAAEADKATLATATDKAPPAIVAEKAPPTAAAGKTPPASAAGKVPPAAAAGKTPPANTAGGNTPAFSAAPAAAALEAVPEHVISIAPSRCVSVAPPVERAAPPRVRLRFVVAQPPPGMPREWSVVTSPHLWRFLYLLPLMCASEDRGSHDDHGGRGFIAATLL